MSESSAQTVILYRQGDQEFITFGNSQPLEVKVVESAPIQVSGENLSLSPSTNRQATQYMVVGGDNAVDAIDYAGQIGRLDFASSILAAVGIVIAIMGFVGYFNFRQLAKKQATSEAGRVTPSCVVEYMQDHGVKLVSEALLNPEMLAEMYGKMSALGLVDSDEAENVEGSRE